MIGVIKRRWPMPANWPAAVTPDLRPAADGAGAGPSDKAGPRPLEPGAASFPPRSPEGVVAGASVTTGSRWSGACSSSDPSALIRQMVALMDLATARLISCETAEEWAWVIRHEHAERFR